MSKEFFAHVIFFQGIGEYTNGTTFFGFIHDEIRVVFQRPNLSQPLPFLLFFSLNAGPVASILSNVICVTSETVFHPSYSHVHTHLLSSFCTSCHPKKDTHVVSAMIGHLEKDARLREQKDNRPLSHQFRRPRLTERYLQKVEATEKIAFSAISCKSRSDTEILIIHCPFLQKA